MTKTEVTYNCPACGADMIRDSRPDTIEYKSRRLSVDQPGWYCTNCDEVVLTADDARAADAAYVDLRAETDGLLPAPQIARIRKRLKLSQRKAGLILGGGPRAFQKYESRKGGVSKALSNLLVLLDKHPDQLAELEERKKA